MSSILSGMRVVEASAFVAAPLGGMTLAQLGADVIRIDAIGGGLDYRRWPVTKDNVSLFWAGLNKSKRSVAINFRSPEGSELAKQIITAPGKEAGMLLTNFPPKGWLSYEDLKAIRPDMIQLTVQGDRHGGSAVDYTVNPAIGLPFLTGPSDSNSPTNHVLPAWDLVTGQMAALGLLAAERHRYRTGEGQHTKIALADAAMAVMGHLGFIAEAQLGEERPRYGNYLFGAFGRDFTTSDGERVMVIGLTKRQWKSLCIATETAEKMDQLAATLGRDFSQEGARFESRDEISALFSDYISKRSFKDIESRFNENGVCWSKYQTVKEMVDSDPECSLDNPMFNQIDQPGVGSFRAAGAPWNFSAFERQPAQPAPKLGQQTDEVLSEVVGLSSAEIGRLHDAGIVAGPE
ncbi:MULTISPECIES: CoA transferase [unclassified Oleiphilus]|uniref:CoA transferase n=2 Tax=Oleiphilus TaxID=141450 RepID=UPI0007C39AB1|nr:MULTISPECIES: CoA transferase [unclassified Oleiphilus]KZY42569.1 mesaconyl-CoA isomerase [Oleiphilus sp. HI0050]KZY76685.1 mesaconyl-CoA isomerase [Oleiphilus sp. HI0068]KZY78606.1 mesaconyl-CoA isomerase [Oleiphilus sp. HI0069]KZY87589.1 mesaconyl-CoA isomerase [Oleiphilus sp. HI0072]KZZ08492.1 mesaconyl-CoA isomerase [Oleiphilus sp. HI0078]KZZ47843.1 mesaconyl-CoA isomerase [Oleiphilus sp. HI0085]